MMPPHWQLSGPYLLCAVSVSSNDAAQVLEVLQSLQSFVSYHWNLQHLISFNIIITFDFSMLNSMSYFLPILDSIQTAALFLYYTTPPDHLLILYFWSFWLPDHMPNNVTTKFLFVNMKYIINYFKHVMHEIICMS